MRRGRGNKKGGDKKSKKVSDKGPAATAAPLAAASLQPDATTTHRRSTAPIVVICHSDQTGPCADPLVSDRGWQVVVHNPDNGTWWDRLSGKKSRVLPNHWETKTNFLHVVVFFRSTVNNDDDDDFNPSAYKAMQRLGESAKIVSIALVKTSINDVPPLLQEYRMELETAMMPHSIVVNFTKESLSHSYLEVRRLWAFQDDCEVAMVATDHYPRNPLRLSDIDDICLEWSNLMWRWNGTRVRDLYRGIRRHDWLQETGKAETQATEGKTDETTKEEDFLSKHEIQKLRRTLEEKAKQLLADPDTARVADLVLTATSDEDEHRFGRILARARSIAKNVSNARFLVVVPSKSKKTTILNAYGFATCQNCSEQMEQLKLVSVQERPQDKFSVPVLDNSMLTVGLVPALFPTGIKSEAMGGGAFGGISHHRFDSVLGSQRIWEEHMALKASIIYLFHGQPGSLWDLCMRVVRAALPRTWDLLLREEPPDEGFLRALLHPEVVEAGRLLRTCKNPDGTTSRLLPPSFEDMSRIFALGRFVRTLEDPLALAEDATIRRAVAKTMQIRQEWVIGVVRACQKGSLYTDICYEILQSESRAEKSKPPLEGHGMTEKVMEVLGMLGLFLNRDRKSVKDANRFDPTDLEPQPYATTKALVDCAMYCGTVRWLSEDEDDEEGIWTCLPCLHRWQKRGPREAYQTRKLMHPMKMTQFTREEYYDCDDWDKIMEATGGNISMLGVDYYWGRCSTEGCGRLCQAVARAGACAETDGVPLADFPETVVLEDGLETIQLRRTLEALGPLGPNNIVTGDSLEKYFDSEERLMYLAPPDRRRVRNCIDKSTYILPRGLLCDFCGAVGEENIDDYCPYCGTGFEPVFACVHYSCPQCHKHFCKACKGIDGIHYHGVYSARNHVCWRILGNRYAYHNKGICGRCQKERPWPESHALVSAGPEIRKQAHFLGGEGMPLEAAVQMQSSNLEAFTARYKEGVRIFLSGAHTQGMGPDYCHCGEYEGQNDYEYQLD